ncbi:MAG: hypothetical protein JRF51_06930 [Deltaproteobacteria bacterium]|nr:hypothetical protein [Deltaproteobacteria bacterium]MBW2110067.1 hypothetical protein [Deltaproteobacteria bacterium]MBW2352950.1 hypothetical protein [Deltaproteobacteria bacterium]HDZ90689.1 hypothetical protein [Deltaproteobacteria bacterium]
MKKTSYNLIALILLMLLITGCARVALYAASPIIPGLTQAFFEECDLKLAGQSLPAELKLMEGLLKNAPENRELLTALCMGFTGYAMLFVEEQDPERASRLYLRARGYGLRALGIKDNAPLQTITKRLGSIAKKGIRPLFWVTMSWNGWINLNLDRPDALGQLGTAEKCLKRVMEIDPRYFYGSPYIVEATMLAARPKILGGDAERAKELFVEAVSVTKGRFFLAQYHYARYYAVRVQDRDLFMGLIREVERASPDGLKEACLINSAMKKRMKALEKQVDELFL